MVIYKAIIVERENGQTDVFYDCDIKKNIRCSKESCGKCKRTTNKEYAKEYTWLEVDNGTI